MSTAEQMMQFDFLGIDIKRYNFSQCIDELIKRHKELLADREFADRQNFETFLYNIKKYQN